MFFFFLFFIGIVCNWFQNCTVFFILTLHQAVLWLDLSLWRWPQKKWSVILKVYFIANKSKYVWIHECTLFSLVAFIYVSHFCQIGYGGITLLWKRQMQDVCVCVCVYFLKMVCPSLHASFSRHPSQKVLFFLHLSDGPWTFCNWEPWWENLTSQEEFQSGYSEADIH